MSLWLCGCARFRFGDGKTEKCRMFFRIVAFYCQILLSLHRIRPRYAAMREGEYAGDGFAVLRMFRGVAQSG